MAKQEQIGDVPGNVLGMLADLNHKLQHGNITPNQLERFLKKQNPFNVAITDKDEILSVMVNRDRSIADGIAAGKYDWHNSDISEKHFPCTGSGNEATEIILVHFDEDMSTENVLKKLDRRNLRPADVRDLLAIGEQHPDKQRAFPVIALGSVWQDPDGLRRVPFLDVYGAKRKLYLHWLDAGWHRYCRFAALRK